ncbi:MAG: SUMF1/EgtB/PvdO family nonheme iron enzyme [Salinivirgaceae bacterium]|nr:SUMF1/EgtB/PvdO family nonheme iron enzyme [Salinivirgaceae bacterium]
MRKLFTLIFAIMLTGQSIQAQKTDSGWYVPGYTEQIAMNYFNSTTMLAPVEGIWQSSDGYKYAIEKDVENNRRVSSKFRVIVLESSFDGWELGEIKGFITPGSVESVYSFKYYTRPSDRTSTSSQNVFLMVESPVIMTFERIDASGKIAMYRIYPQVDGSAGGSGGSAFQNNAPQWSGSGIVIADKYIATNNHVVEDAQSLVVCGIGGDFNTTYKLQVVAVDKNNDLAIVKIVDEKFKGFGMLPYGFNFSTVDVGTEIFALGYPKTDMMGNEVKVTNGIINSKTGFQGDVTKYQMSATVDHGNSGGPVFDYKGNLIGISQSIIGNEHARNVNYAVKSIYLQTLIQSCTEKINVPNQNIIVNFQLSDKIKAITPFVLMIKANTAIGENGNTSSGFSQGSQIPQSADKEKAEFLEKRAREKYGNQDYYGAYADIKESVKLFPKAETHHLRYYLALSVGNDTTLAIESLKYCISNNYELEECNYALGYIYGGQKKYSDAIVHLTNALAENKRNVGALFIRAICKTELKDKPGAIADYTQAIKYEGLVDGNYGTIYNNLAFAYLRMGNYELAEKYIKEALNRDHLTNYIWDTDGELAYKTGDYDRCIKSMNNAITIKGEENSYYYRILAKIKLNNLVGAYHDIELLKSKNSERADSLLRTIDISKINFEQEDGYEDIIVSPVIKSKSHNYLYVKAIERAAEYTAIHFIVSAIGTDGHSYNVDKDCFIQNGDVKYYLLKAERVALNPQVSNVLPDMKAEFVLYFPSVDKNCSSLDFYNWVGDKWWMQGIQMKSSDIKNEEWDKTQNTQKGNGGNSSNVKYLSGAMQINVDGYGIIEMIKVEAGSFTMGATKEQGAGGVDDNEYPVHNVTIVNDYYIGMFEVTQRLWNFVMKKNPSGYLGDELPVANVTWKECQEFITKLSALAGKKFRLPTEAEWEFAARGGNKSRGYKYSGSNVLDDVAWHRVNARGRLQFVGTKQPNELGIYDMSGNVLEWCNDYYGKYKSASQASPKGPDSGVRRVLRGGAVRWESSGCRVSARYGERAGERDEHFGFRLACD